MAGRVGADSVSVVIVDADPAQRRLISNYLEQRTDRRFSAVVCTNAREALASGSHGNVLLADLESIGGAGGIGELARGEMPVVATSIRGSVQSAVAAMQAGAVDFVAKPIGVAALVERLEAAIASWGAKPIAAKPSGKTEPTPAKPKRRYQTHTDFIGQSAPMLEIYGLIERIGASRAPVFITGESGTGKELCAETIHRRGGEDRPFVALNCSAMPKDLIESEIFGHVRGAFTGATENRPGAAELAHAGTLFLDEIGEMDVGLQAKLLRFIQTGTVRRVGGNETVSVDVRFICATNRDPLTELRAGRFREDLFYRLNVLPIRLPALRERSDDILTLANEFLLRFSAEEGRNFEGFHVAAADLLCRYPWPGNVRQLQNVIRRIVVMHDGSAVTVAMLPTELKEIDEAVAQVAAAAAATPLVPFWRQERQIVEAAIAACGGNVPRAAAALELAPSTIYRKRLAWNDERSA